MSQHAQSIRSVHLTRSDTGADVVKMDEVLAPTSWSDNAVLVVASKYLAERDRDAQGRPSIPAIVERVLAVLGEGDAEGALDLDNLRTLLLGQAGSFNSPVWFNVGVRDEPQVAACFITAADDTLPSVLDWIRLEGSIFAGGSGSGINLSNIRADGELIAGGGSASGPIAFMRGADAAAGSIKSGGRTRRAAKMVILDADHPDVVAFIESKAREERKAKVLAEAGFDLSLDGPDATSLQFQNANHSVRLTDAQMRAAADGGDINLTTRVDGSIAATIPASAMLDAIARAAWECADPGVQFADTINRWHTTPEAGPIRASNPCSEYLHLDNSACNLASLNLVAFLREGRFDVDAYASAARQFAMSLDILIDRASYPTTAIADNARAFRQLGVGYANLGGLLLRQGIGYGTPEARSIAAACASLLTAAVYGASAERAATHGVSDQMKRSMDSVRRVLSMHAGAAEAAERLQTSQPIWDAARAAWSTTLTAAELHGVRNAQATVLAPTGTIGLMMDCATTGIEPALALVTSKRLVGGGQLRLVVDGLADGLHALGYGKGDVTAIVDHLTGGGSVGTAPQLLDEHHHVFATAMGDIALTPREHVDMVAAVTPHLSGGVSKTVNLPSSAQPADIRELIVHGWQAGVKCLSVYRDGSKAAQPVRVAGVESQGACFNCGTGMRPAGTCFICPSCGTTTGCS